MLDFLKVSTRVPKRGLVEIYPKFVIPTRSASSDLMVRGKDFYAIYDESSHFWKTDEATALYLIDSELDAYANEHRKNFEDGNNTVKVLHMWDSDSGMIDKWHKYVQKQLRDNYHPLDEKLIFSNTEVKKEDYASKRLPYPLENAETPAYDELVSRLYSPENRKKYEWCIGSIITGAAKKNQKFGVLYGPGGSGKSTLLQIASDLMEGYWTPVDITNLGSGSNSFALESFTKGSLLAIQHDGDLSKIEDNTLINEIVSHEPMIVNEKFKSKYTMRFVCFLFMGTNKPVRITDAKSGIIRRLIDISPTGKTFTKAKYDSLMAKIKFELGGIAAHCRDVYLSDPGAYDNYIPVAMIGASNDFYNYILEYYDDFKRDDGTTLKDAWDKYNIYCERAKIPERARYTMRPFKEELKNYFESFKDRTWTDNDSRVRNVYSGFIFDKYRILDDNSTKKEPEKEEDWLEFKKIYSLFDDICKDCKAQYATQDKMEKPEKRWSDVTTTLKDISTSKTHYVQIPTVHVVIDFDLKDKDGNKSLELNKAAANKWPRTYAELSKSGQGIHLHYIYKGDPLALSNQYSDNIEIKVFTGNSSLRRKLTLCNDIPIAVLSSGLPLKKEVKKIVKPEYVKTEKKLRDLIMRNLQKEFHPGTKPSMDFIAKILTDAKSNGLVYDVRDLEPLIFAFASRSTNQSEYCKKLAVSLPYCSEDIPDNIEDYDDDSFVFFDCEVFPNLLVIVWKKHNSNPMVMINPSPEDVENLLKFRLIGFNNKKYDNHILWARMMGYSNESLYNLSQQIIGNHTNGFKEAENISYTDIYDFSSEKKSLKKFEIDLGIHHLELNYKWDEPVPEEHWNKVADYCINDVIATETLFYSEARQADFTARKILADLANSTVNDSTNHLTQKIIFGTNRHPQDEFNYRHLGGDDNFMNYPEDTYTVFDDKGRAIFPGYKMEFGKSIYRGEYVGEGGYVYAEQGIFEDVVTLDVSSMHPHTIKAEELFGSVYTEKFYDLVRARLAIKKKDFETAKSLFGGALTKYLEDEKIAGYLSMALKIAINSVYGLTAAKFSNPFRDPRNVDNIVAKRGALFMVNLKYEVQKRGFRVVHIKTDSIKIEKPTEDIIKFVQDYGKMYGYSFTIESKYKKMCLVNDAVYIAKCAEDDPDHPNQWTATGAQFQHPFVFKTLFSKEPIKFEDLCETKSVTTALYLDMNENLPEGEHNYIFVGRVGQFCPVYPGTGGGNLCREKDGKYYAATGTKGYLWQDAEVLRLLHKEQDVNLGYFDALAKAAIKSISEYGDFDKFANE